MKVLYSLTIDKTASSLNFLRSCDILVLCWYDPQFLFDEVLFR